MLLSRDAPLRPSEEAMLARFHAGIYWDAFAAQHEPLDVWRAALRGEFAYELRIKLAFAGPDFIAGGIVYERYPRSGCGLVTYFVIAPTARRTGLGRQLHAEAVGELHALGAPVVLGEINDPRCCLHEAPAVAWERLLRFQRWGARVLDMRYVQPALGPGLERARGLVLVAHPGAQPLPPTLPGDLVRGFLDEFYEVTEGGPVDPEIVVPDEIHLITLAP